MTNFPLIAAHLAKTKAVVVWMLANRTLNGNDKKTSDLGKFLMQKTKRELSKGNYTLPFKEA